MYMCCHLREVKKNGSENYVAHRIQGKRGEKFTVCHYELPTTTPSYILNINIHIFCVVDDLNTKYETIESNQRN